MKLKMLCATLLACAAPVTFAAPGTCAVPTIIDSTQTPMTISGSTCGGDTGINLGGLGLQNPTAVYKFTWHANSANPNTMTMTTAAPSGDAFNYLITPGCTQAPVVNGAGGTNVPADLNSMGLQDGTDYYLFVTVDPSVAPTPNCGDYTLNTGTLPVELQKFSVN